MPNEPVKDVSERQNRARQLLKNKNNHQNTDNQHKRAQFGFRRPIDVFEARVVHIADHQPGDE